MSPGPYIGVDVAILKGNRVLLTRREDFDVWCLPGGAVSPGESLAQTAVREVREETSLEIELLRLVGIYSFPNWHRGGSHIVTFAATPSGGELHVHPGEVREARYFSGDGLPEALLMGVRQRIIDALAGCGGGISGYTPGNWPFPPDMDRERIYQTRDLSGLSRKEFYQGYFNARVGREMILEVPPNGISRPMPTDQHRSEGVHGETELSDLGQPMIGAGVAVIQNGKALLTKREDFEVWCLPGGAVDEGESVEQAAIREISEETGLSVELERMVGIYSEPNWFNHGLHVVLFAGHPVGGRMQPQPAEVVEMDFFGQEELPDDFLVEHRKRLQHAFMGVGGSVYRSQDARWPFQPEIDRLEIYEMRDASGMGRREFYMKYFSEVDVEDQPLDTDH